ncbi:hypothetical protein [Saccharothrix australiensis]|uniref:hypothetical protein n=1 Tax=Saccharothrix australiensis TaxID=2072 RepID=UPI0011C38E0B|nr:hypothetical protein [Saccharothrix australiensis]
MRLSSLARSHVVVRYDDEVPRARAAVERADAEYAVVVTSDGVPLGVLGRPQLAAPGTATLTALADRCPVLAVVGGEPDELHPDELVDLADLVVREGLAFVLVERDGLPSGVVPRAAIEQALPLDLPDGSAVRSGNPDVAALRYVCRKCAPPTFHLPRAPEGDGRPPHCRRVFFHGAMEPDA